MQVIKPRPRLDRGVGRNLSSTRPWET